MARVGWVSISDISSVEIAGAAQVGVLQDGGWLRVAGGFGGQAVGQDGGNALAGERADLEGARRDRLSARGGEIAQQAQNSEAGPKALLRVRAMRQNGRDQSFRLRADRSRPAAEALRGPVGIAPVGTGHMVRVGAMPTAT